MIEHAAWFGAGFFAAWALFAGIGGWKLLQADLAEDRWPRENGARNRRGL